MWNPGASIVTLRAPLIRAAALLVDQADRDHDEEQRGDAHGADRFGGCPCNLIPCVTFWTSLRDSM